MRKTYVAIALAALLPVTALAMPGVDRAHRGPAHHGQHDGGPARFFEGDREKQAAFQTLQREYRQTRQAIPQRYLDKLPEAERQAMQNDIKAADEHYQKGFRALLTPEQLQRYDEQIKQRQARQAERAEFAEWKKQRDSAKN